MQAENAPLVAVVMGSRSDWETLEHACTMLDSLAVAYECQVISAHRTPDLLFAPLPQPPGWPARDHCRRRWRAHLGHAGENGRAGAGVPVRSAA